MAKIDLAASDKAYYSPPRTPVLIQLDNIPYLSVTGKGAPMGTEHAAATEALYSVAYALKFEAKALGKDFTVAKLEGQWWWADKYLGLGPDQVPRDEWEWRLLIRQPDFVQTSLAQTAISKAKSKKPGLPSLEKVRFEHISEGSCVQIMHLGPFATEPASIALIHAFMRERGLIENGHHHELYISDMRKTPQEKARTILRQPVKPALT